MHRLQARYVSRLLAIVVLLLAATCASYAHGSRPRITALTNQDPETTTTAIHLPLIRAAAQVSPLQFAEKLDDAGNPVNPATTFGYGIQYLYVVTTVENGSGSTWGIKWILNDKHVPELDLEGSISASRQRVTDFICGLVQASPPRCEALPRGTYRVDFFLDGELYQTRTAVIQ